MEIGFAQRPCPGFTVSGDAVVVREEEKAALFGVVDALGHGPKAAEVARVALEYLEQVELQESVASIIEGLHEALRHTRGAAAGLCLARSGYAELSIVGNVEIHSVGTKVGVVASPGILGRKVRALRTSRTRLRSGDRIAVFSDGLSRVDLHAVRRLCPSTASRDLLRVHARPSDDASIVVADFVP